MKKKRMKKGLRRETLKKNEMSAEKSQEGTKDKGKERENPKGLKTETLQKITRA